MTTTDLIAACRQAGIVITTAGENVAVEAPADRLTPEIREAIRARKPELLAVLWRLDGMRLNIGKAPIPCAKLTAKGGPGYCFSCGDRHHEHPHAYGRCQCCAIAAELLYAEIPDAADRWQPALRDEEAIQ